MPNILATKITLPVVRTMQQWMSSEYALQLLTSLLISLHQGPDLKSVNLPLNTKQTLTFTLILTLTPHPNTNPKPDIFLNLGPRY